MTAPAAPKKGDRVRVTYEATYDLAFGPGTEHRVTAGSAGVCFVPADATIEVLSPSWATARGSVIRFGDDLAYTYTCYGRDDWRRYVEGVDGTLETLRAAHGEPTVLYDASKS